MEPQARKKVITFFSSYKPRALKRGQLLIRAGENPQGIFYLESGVVRQYVISQKGDEVVLNIYKEGSFFPMSWAIADIANNYYYEAVVDGSVRIASKAEVQKFAVQEPQVVLDLLKRLYKGVEGVFMHIEHLMSGNARTKLLVSLLIFAKRFGSPQKDGTHINLSMTEKDLAAYSGMARETVSRELGKLIHEKVIAFSGHHLVVRNLAAIEEELGRG